MDGLLVWSLDGVGGGGEDVGEWLGGEKVGALSGRCGGSSCHG